jgi:cell pole-organizing protein PopZ
MAQPHQEPSMEDILASIKRIIAEDSEAVGARAPKLRREAMAAVSASPVVTPLREPEPEEEPQVEEEAAEPEPEPIAEASPEPVAAEGDAPDILELTSPMPEADTAEAPAIAPSSGLDGLLSSTSAAASRSAFAALSQLQVRSEEGQSNTLEGLVSDMLKPMLREWLDRELPALVERVVSAEVKRLAGH